MKRGNVRSTVEGGSKVEVMKVSSKSISRSVADSLVAELKKKDKVKMRAIGAGAVNQTIKAIAIARRFIISSGFDLFFVPVFTDIDINGEVCTAITFLVELQKNSLK